MIGRLYDYETGQIIREATPKEILEANAMRRLLLPVDPKPIGDDGRCRCYMLEG